MALLIDILLVMSREKTLFIIAILIMVLPHLGFPNLVERITLLIFGLIILIFAYSLYFDKKKKVKRPTVKKASVSPMPPLAKKEITPDTSGFVFVKKSDDKSNENFSI